MHKSKNILSQTVHIISVFCSNNRDYKNKSVINLVKELVQYCKNYNYFSDKKLSLDEQKVISIIKKHDKEVNAYLKTIYRLDLLCQADNLQGFKRSTLNRYSCELPNEYLDFKKRESERLRIWKKQVEYYIKNSMEVSFCFISDYPPNGVKYAVEETCYFEFDDDDICLKCDKE